jgi:hypothetical protein
MTLVCKVRQMPLLLRRTLRRLSLTLLLPQPLRVPQSLTLLTQPWVTFLRVQGQAPILPFQ